jgi:hypothetical protein
MNNEELKILRAQPKSFVNKKVLFAQITSVSYFLFHILFISEPNEGDSVYSV